MTVSRRHATAFLAGLTSLALELVLVRLLAFFLTNATDFLAIPLALLGLALGSMFAHYAWKGSMERLASLASGAVLPVLVASLLALFGVFDLFFFQVHVSIASIATDLGRLVVYSAILLPPFAAFGALFAALFAEGSEDLGRLYAADLAGAATGCVLAPALLTVAGLPPTLLAVVLGALLLVLVDRGRGVAGQLAAVALFLLVAAGVAGGVLFREHPDPETLAHSAVPRNEKVTVDSLLVRWNQIARADLLRIEHQGRPSYYVVQDNGLSNVTLQTFPSDEHAATASVHDLPWNLGRVPERVLVMFAGAGRDMMNFDTLSGGKADLTGVELNPAVRELALAVPELHERAFLAKPNVHLRISEGRDFLDHETGTYDLVYVANNGAVAQSITGHTRKFLDTREAMAAYLDRLSPHGLMMFVNQPVAEKITSFRELFAERGLGDFGRAAYVYGPPRVPKLYSLIVAKDGFTPEEVRVLDREVRSIQLQTMFRPGPAEGLDRLGSTLEVTDDRPFTRGLELSRLGLDPTHHQHDIGWISSWVKVLTVLLFAALSGLAGILVLSRGRGDARVPGRWVAFLGITGVGYMCVEIGLLARSELFVGNPLYAVALCLAVFLVASALGSFLSSRRLANPLVLAVLAGAAVAWGLFATDVLAGHALSLPLAVKALLVAGATGPAGVALGTFYPHAVARVGAEGRAAAVPATYALTTLSSVLGSAFAATAMIDLGFREIVMLGGLAYLLAGALAWPGSTGRRA